MSLKKLIYSFSRRKSQSFFRLSIDSTTQIKLAIETTDAQPYFVDFGDGNINEYQSSIFENIYNINGVGNDVKVYVSKDRIKSLATSTSQFSFTSDVFVGMNNIEKISINASVSINISDIPNSFEKLLINGENSSLTGGYSGYNFITPIQVFVLNNQTGVGLTPTEVDNLLIDLSKAQWLGNKKLSITGVNQVRTSASDSAISLLQLKGVIILIN